MLYGFVNDPWPCCLIQHLCFVTPQICLDSRKGLLDGIEVRRVRREVDQFGTALANNNATDVSIVMNCTVVEYNDAARTRIRGELRGLERVSSAPSPVKNTGSQNVPTLLRGIE